jgi:hypothetical protein
MGLIRVSAFALCALLLACAGSAMADEYRADEFFGLDLSNAVLSPKRLGPPTEFAPVAVEARAEPKAERKILVRTTRIVPKNVVRTARAVPRNVMRTARVVPRHDVVAKPRIAAPKPRIAARTKLARRHTSPLDAQAMDTRVQVWPCRSGGICDWKR